MKKVSAYLDMKARSPDKNSSSCYATLREISDAICERYIVVDDSLRLLLRQGQIKVFPNASKWRRLFGAKSLPEIKQEEVFGLIRSTRMPN